MNIVGEIAGYEYAKSLIEKHGYYIVLEDAGDESSDFFIYNNRQKEFICSVSTVDQLKAFSFGLEEGKTESSQSYVI